MRDKLMSEQYFSEYIQEEIDRINNFNIKLMNNKVKEDRIYSVMKKMDSIKFGIMVARYSSGEDLDKIKIEYEQLLNDMPLYWNNSSYLDMLWMMSLAILFDVDKEQFSILSDLVLKNEMNDALLQFMIRYKLEDDVDCINGELIFDEPYKSLLNIRVGNDDNTEILKLYLSKEWYIGHKDTGWYDIHKHKEKLYYGYWSFEAGAIAKILNLDDSSLKDVPYYPYDLVHYKNEK